MTEWNGDALMQSLREEAAKGLIAAAVFYANTLRQKVSRSSPFRIGPRGGRQYYDPSRPGEYPKLRTGAGQKSISLGAGGRAFDARRGPAIADVLANGMAVQVGYEEPNHHLLPLEFAQGRKGLIDLLDEMRPQLAALATAGFRDER